MSAGGWSRLYRTLLRLLPDRLRERRAHELAEVFEQLLADARRSRGSGAARSRAARECWDLARLVVRTRMSDLFAWNGETARDLRLGARALRHRPNFALSAVATLAVGIGAAGAVFAVADTLILRPLPYPQADRLVMLWRVIERIDMRRAPISLPNFVDWKDGVAGFEAAAAWSPAGPTLVGAGDPLRLKGYRVTGDFFSTLGLPVAEGRPLLPADDDPNAERVVVLSHALWTSRFGGDAALVGRTIDLNGAQVRVVGVARPDFDFPVRGADIWLPLAQDPTTADRDLNFLSAIARLEPGVSPLAAEEEFKTAQARVAETYPDGNEVDDVWIEPLRAWEIGESDRVVFLLAAAVGLLLAISCANLTALLLVRGAARERELAVRAALGGGSGRIARALLAEGLVVAVLGGALGVVIASGLLRGLAAVAPAELLRRGLPTLDARLLAFCLAASGACVLACAWLPARAAARRAPSGAMREGSIGPGRGRARVHDGLVVGQVALATILLVGAGLLGSSLDRLLAQPLGFDPDPVLTLQLNLPRSRYPNAAAAGQFYDALIERLAAHPAVVSAGGTWALPFTPTLASTGMRAEGAPESGEPVSVMLVPVRGSYFGAMQIPLLEGRAFSADDRSDAPPVGIASQSLADALFPGRSPLGLRTDEGITIVGVAADVRAQGLEAEPAHDLYLPQEQSSWASNDIYLTLRVENGEPLDLIPDVRAAVAALDPALPRDGAMGLSQRVVGSASGERARTLLVGGFAAAAALLAAIGVYGVLAYRVSQRRPELALRVALGASRNRVQRSVLARAGVIGFLGMTAGLGAAALGMPKLRVFLFDISPLQPSVYLSVAAVVAGAVVAAGWLPARRAARVDPLSTLRGE